MTVEYHRTIMHDVDVGGDGEITITSTGGYHGEDATREFSLNDMKHIMNIANAHSGAYQAYVDRGYEDAEMYKLDFDFIAKM